MSAFHHLVLMKKIPFASKGDTWASARPEWEPVGWGIVSQGDDEGVEFVMERDGNRIDQDEFFEKYGVNGVFDFTDHCFGQFIDDKKKYPLVHSTSWNRCTCTHDITKACFIFNRETRNMVLVGRDCYTWFFPNLREELTHELNLRKCGCGRIYYVTEERRIIQGKRARDIQRGGCYLCACKVVGVQPMYKSCVGCAHGSVKGARSFCGRCIKERTIIIREDPRSGTSPVPAGTLQEEA